VFVPHKLFKPILTKSVAYYKNLQIMDRKFYNIGPWVQCYKTFSVCNLRILVVSLSLNPWEAFHAYSNKLAYHENS